MNQALAVNVQPEKPIFSKTQFKDYPDVLTVQQTAELLAVCKNTVYKLIRSIKVGKAIRIPKTVLLDYVKGCGYNEDEADKRPYREGGKQ